MIPKLFHYLWIGPYHDEVTVHEQWTTSMPDYTKVIWDNNSAKDYIFRAVELFGLNTLQNKSFTYLSDLVRLLILKDHGGIYLDHDVEIYKDFTELLDTNLVLTYQYNNDNNELLPNYTKGSTLAEIIEKEYSIFAKTSSTVNNCFIAVVPNHPFIDSAIEATLEHHFLPKDKQYAMMDWGVGPDIFTQVADSWGFNTKSCKTEIRKDVKILSNNYLHAVHGNIRSRLGRDIYEDCVKQAKQYAYAVHLHTHTGAKQFKNNETIPLVDWLATL
jgi:mannosyltransferase OCH1-like enzyme